MFVINSVLLVCSVVVRRGDWVVLFPTRVVVVVFSSVVLGSLSDWSIVCLS